jgi:hypothetical protein
MTSSLRNNGQIAGQQANKPTAGLKNGYNKSAAGLPDRGKQRGLLRLKCFKRGICAATWCQP